MNQPTLYLMLGYPGAGKTTVANMIQEKTGGIRFSSDELRLKLFKLPSFTQKEHDSLYRELDSKLEKAMQQKTPVIIYDANLNRLQHRQEKYDLADKYGYKIMLIWIQTPKAVAKRRRIEDAHHHLVPQHENIESMFDRIVDIFEPPNEDEPYSTIDGTKVSETALVNIINHNPDARDKAS